MLENYYLKPKTIDRIRANWLAEPIERYVTWLHDRGYAARNVFHRVPFLLRFGAYAQSKGAKAWSDLPQHVQGFVDDWMRGRQENHRTERARKCLVNAVRGPIEQMLRLLLPDFAGTGRGCPFPFTEQAPGFVAHLRDERGLRPKTLRIYRHCLRHLQAYLKEIKLGSPAELSPTILSAFVTKCSEGWGTSMLSSVCAVLRVFLRYLFREKLVPQDLSQCIEGPRQYRLSSIPRSISWKANRGFASTEKVINGACVHYGRKP
jgi:integrase/recombinase XerD